MRPTHKFDHGLIAPPRADDERDQRPVCLVGIDDTDNADSPGTGFHARQLGRLLHEQGLAALLDITRHQLLFDPRVPYTSHNSSLCLRLKVADEALSQLVEICRAYLAEQSAPGSDAGLCVMKWSEVPPEVEAFGYRAKTEVLDLGMARALAGEGVVHFEGLTGDHGGMIGALAAVGLRRSDRDGRIAWLPGIRETTGVVSAGELLANTGIDEIRPFEGGDAAVKASDRIDVTPWPRAVLIEGKAVLLVQQAGNDHDSVSWRLAAKPILKAY